MEPTGASPVEDSQISEMVDFLMAKADSIGVLLAKRYREEIVEYRSLPEGFIEQDVAPTARHNLETMLLGLSHDATITNEHLDRFRESAVRRFRQGVPIQALLHAYRLWGHTVWDQVQMAPQVADYPEGALRIAGKIMQHVDYVSAAVTEAYLDEASGMIHDREKGRRDFLEALIAGNQPGRIATHAKHFNLKVDGSYFVVLVRRRPGRQNTSISMRVCLETVQKSISGTQAKVGLAGARDEEVVAIVEAIRGTPLDSRDQLDRLASSLPEFSVTVGRLREGLPSVAQGYVDAQNATSFAVLNKTPRAYLFSDTLLDQIARSSPFRHDLAGDTTDLIAACDAKRGSGLLETIRAYVDCGFKLVQTAEILRVQPNTVKYRLNRIAQVTGHDPLQVQGMTLFTLALRIPPGPDSA